MSKMPPVKTRIILSVVVLVVGFTLGIAFSYYAYKNPIPGVRIEERTQKIGVGCGILISFVFACIWLPWAAKMGKAKREAQQRKSSKPRRRRRR
jgi:uncharacterized membrane protein